MFEIPLKVISVEEVRYLRTMLRWILIITVSLFIFTLVVPVFKSVEGSQLVCDSVKVQLGQYLLGSSLSCIWVSVGRLAIYIALLYVAGIAAAALTGERGWVGLLTSIFSPDGNNSQIITLIVLTVFLWETAYNVHYTVPMNFFISTLYFVSRNVLTFMAFSFAGMKILHLTGARELGSLEAFLREQVTRYSDGLPYFMALMAIASFFFWRVVGG